MYVGDLLPLEPGVLLIRCLFALLRRWRRRILRRRYVPSRRSETTSSLTLSSYSSGGGGCKYIRAFRLGSGTNLLPNLLKP